MGRDIRVRRPPPWARALLKLTLPRGPVGEAVLGDLDEEFRRLLREQDSGLATRWYLREAVSVARYAIERRLASLPVRPRTNALPSGRSARSGGFMSFLGTDIRQVSRTLRRNPGPVLVSVLSLSLGIGATATMLSVVDAIDFRPLPYRDSNQLVQLGTRGSGGTGRLATAVPSDVFPEWENRVRSFEALAAASFIVVAFGEGGERVLGASRVTADFFEVLGVAPILGRAIGSGDVTEGQRVAVISYDAWQTVFAGVPDVVGQVLPASWAGEFRSVGAEPYTVVGVLPQGARYPRGNDVWIPATDAIGGMVTVVGRLRPGVTVPAAQAEIENVSFRLAADDPDRYEGWTGAVTPLREAIQVLADRRGASARYLLLAVAGFTLLLAVINAAVVFLVRAARQDHDLRIRTALGAPWSRVVMVALLPGLMVALASGGLGLLLASWGIQLADARLAVSASGLSPVLDARIVAAGLAISLVAGLTLGLFPALRYRRPHRHGSLLIRTAGDARGVSGGRIQNLLVVGQVACALVLLNGAGVLSRDFLQTMSAEPGFDEDGVLVAGLQGIVSTDAAAEVADRMAGLPGIVSVAIGGQPAHGYTYRLEDRDSLPGGEEVHFRRVSADYFSTLGIPLLAGRAFTTADRDGAAPVGIVSRSAAQAWWPGEVAIGKAIFMGSGPTEGEWVTVVGVSGDERVDRDLREPVRPILYRPWHQLAHERRRTEVFARAAAAPGPLIESIRTVLRELRSDAGWQGDYVVTMDEMLGRRLNLQRFRTSALSLFSLFGLVLAAMGIYGVVAAIVHQRTTEVGIRVALGARSADVLALVARQGVVLALVGMVIGGVGAFVSHRVFSSLVVNATAFDAIPMLVAAVFLGGVVLVACYLPGRRATHIAPSIALRE